MNHVMIDYLCIGHCCHDKVANDYILGGTVSYASVIAQGLGARVEVVTSVGPDFQFHDYFKRKEIPLHISLSEETTIFHNIYNGDQRTQYLLARADTISAESIPMNIGEPKIIHIGTIANEISLDIADRYKKALIGFSAQGSMRRWDKDGKIHPEAMDWTQLQKVDIVFISNDDLIGLSDHLPEIIEHSKLLVMTIGMNGVKVYENGTEYFFPSYLTEVLDATGAGDTFAAAFLLKYEETKRIEDACIYAHCASSIIIEGLGLSKIPTNIMVEDRVRRYADNINDLCES